MRTTAAQGKQRNDDDGVSHGHVTIYKLKIGSITSHTGNRDPLSKSNLQKMPLYPVFKQIRKTAFINKLFG